MKKLICYLLELTRKLNPFLKNKEDEPEDYINTDDRTTIILICKQEETLQLNSLTRYYEVNYEQLMSRGVWLLTLMRDSEIKEKKLAVIDIDSSGEIVSVFPITMR